MRGVKRVCDARGKGCPPSALVSFEMPRHALHHRESSGVAWGAWLMDLRQDLLGESAKYLRCSSAALVPASAGSLWSEKRQRVRKRDLTVAFHGMRRTKSGGRASQVLCRLTEQILAEIHQPCTPRDPRTLAMVQGVTRHFERNQRRRRAPPSTGVTYPLYPPHLPLVGVNRG